MSQRERERQGWNEREGENQIGRAHGTHAFILEVHVTVARACASRAQSAQIVCMHAHVLLFVDVWLWEDNVFMRWHQQQQWPMSWGCRPGDWFQRVQSNYANK